MTDRIKPPHSLEWFGTVAFDHSFMRRTIGFGAAIMRGAEFCGWDRSQMPSTIQFGVWLGFVPLCYRDAAHSLARDAWMTLSTGRDRPPRADEIEVVLDALIFQLHADCWALITPRRV